MYPNLFGINNASYVLMMILGIIFAFLIAVFYLKKKKITQSGIIDLLICGCFAVVSGIIFSILFENLYEIIAYKESYKWTWGMTFFGGLFGGAIGFLLTYFIMRKNINFNLLDVLKIAPLSITVAHGFGRIGCFLAGCCYGKHTESWIGIKFPDLGKVIPTQLIEAIFLFALSIVLLVLLLKTDFKYTFIIYLMAYSVFRFIIEFYRDDQRGVATILSPSQIWCIILFVSSIPLFLLIRNLSFKQNEKK